MEQPKIPTLKDAQKPQVKIKGLGAGLTLFDRLKQFKKKDLAFILAGLGTLFMAPLAEHFMMAPENGDHTMQKGWGGGSGSGGGNFFGNGSSPYENGNNSIAQGGAIGGAGDIITPLNVRDPSSLVMGPGGMQQPPAGSAAPAAPPPTAPSRSETDYKDALAGAASRAASAAVKKAPLPIPKIAVGGSGLRGLVVAGGGSSASGGMAPLNSGNLGQAGTGGGGLNLVRSNPNFRGAAGPRGNGPQGLDGTKRAGQNAGDAFSRTGSALNGLNAAAAEQIPTGGKGFDGGGQGGAGANDKAPGGGGAAGSKSVGESLAFLEAKQRQEENLKLEFEKRKLKDPELLMYGIRNEVLKAGALKLGEGLTKKAMCTLLGEGCPGADDEFDCGGTTVNKSQMTMCAGAGKEGATPVDTGCWTVRGSVAVFKPLSGGAPMVCNATGKAGGGTPNPNAEGGVTGFPGVNQGQVAAIAGLAQICKWLDTLIDAKGSSTPDDEYLKTVRIEATRYAVLRDALYQGQNTFGNDCSKVRAENGGKVLDGITTPVAKQQIAALDKLALAEKGLLPSLKKDAEGVKEENYTDDYNLAKKGVDDARIDLEKVRAFSGEALASITVTPIAWSTALQNMPGNKEKLATIESTLKGSRSLLTTSLQGQIAAQDMLDGGKEMDNTKAMPQLGHIIGVPASGTAPIVTTKEVNKKYKDLEEKDPKVKINVDTVAEKYDPTKIGIEKGSGDIETRIADVRVKVTEAKTKDENVDLSKDDPTVKAVQLAKSAMLGTRAAQTTWIDNVNAMVTTARSTVPNK